MAINESGQARPLRFHYAWVVVAVAFVTLLVSAGLRSAPSVLIVPLEDEFGWTRAEISFAIGIQLLVYGLVGPFAAGFAERFGLRKTMLGATMLSIVTFAATNAAGAPWHLAVIWGLGTGLGTGSAALVLSAIIANRWFVARRGLAIGIMTGSAAGGQLLFLPLLADVTVHFGWRSAVWVACGAATLILPVIYFLMRDRPEDVGQRPYGMAPDAPAATRAARVNPIAAAFLALGEAVRSRDFWLLSGSFFVCGGSTIGLIGTHFIPACIDHGIPEGTAANMLAAMGLLTITGTMVSGWLTDRFDSRWLLFWYYLVRAPSLLLLPYAFDASFWGIVAFGVFYGFDWITTVAPTVRLTTNVFGTQRASIIYGWIMVSHQLGSATAAYLSGLTRTEFGNYDPAFILAGAACIVAAMLVLRVGRPSRAAKTPALATAEA
jgi:predicted MFS family arabinose efflux permease